MKWVKFINTGIAFFGLVGIGWLLYLNSTLESEVSKIKRSQEMDIKPAINSLMQNSKTSIARWDALQEFNQNINVPKVIPVAPDSSPSKVLIISPKLHPTPTPAPTRTPRVIVKTRYKAAPTPKPWWKR